MKVRVTVTMDVDPNAWALEYGLGEPGDTPKEMRIVVRNDVAEWGYYLLHGALEQNGLGAKKDAAPHPRGVAA